MGGGRLVEEKESKMSVNEQILYINSEVKRIKEEFDIATEIEIKKYEKIFPEIVHEFPKLRKCKDMNERMMIDDKISGLMDKIWQECYK